MIDTPPPAAAPATSKGNVLLVDDDKFLVEMYAGKFTKEGFTTAAFLSVNDALEGIRTGFKPDVIVMDLLMPERDGFSFLAALKEEKLAPDAIKIALTNQSDDTEQKKALDLGATRYIVKASMIPSEVVTAVAEEISKRKTT